MRRGLWALLLLAIVAFAFALRALGLEHTFLPGGDVLFDIGDPYYHARRSFFSFQNFPFMMLWDPLLNYPTGAAVPWPPLYDLTVAALARLVATTQPEFERFAAWTPCLFGALTALPVVAMGWIAGGPRIALGAAAIFAVLPASIQYSNVGNIDHHAFAALLGATVLALAMALARREMRSVTLAGLGVAFALARAALLLSWPGGVLYVVLADGALAVVGAFGGRPGLLLTQSLSAAVSATLLLPIVSVSGTTSGGPFSATEISQLQPLALYSLALATLMLAALEALRPSARLWVRAVRLLTVSVIVAGLALRVGGLAAELAHGASFLTKADDWGERNVEQLPLFRPRIDGPFETGFALYAFGLYAFLIPLAPVACLVAARDRRRREPLLIAVAATAALGVLALAQKRFGNDFAPVGSVGLALLTAGLVTPLARLGAAAGRWRVAAAVLLGSLLLLPSLYASAVRATESVKALRLRGGILVARSTTGGPDPALRTVRGTLHRFAQEIRRATPATAGFSDVGGRPEYGVIVDPNIGHVIHYVAERATPADNFGPYIGAPNVEAVRVFYTLEEPLAVQLAHALRARYVVTDDVWYPAGHLSVGLHQEDGLAHRSSPRWERFRLVTEGPRGGRPLSDYFGRFQGPGGRAGRGGAPFKLFEIVEGAVLEARAAPGTPIEATVTVATPMDREFTYVASGEAGADGMLRLRVPYATQTEAPAAPTGPYRVRVGSESFSVAVSEEQIRSGATVPVDPRPS